MGKIKRNKISTEVLAAYLDGKATAAECKAIIESLSDDAELREILSISQMVDIDMGAMSVDPLPVTAMAATCRESNDCCMECEKYILNRRKISFDEKTLFETAVDNRWKNDSGTALHNVGRDLENFDLVVTRHFNCSAGDIARALERDEDVIAVVDGGELLGDREEEMKEDIIIGEIPDHAVVILACDLEKEMVTVYDPNSINDTDIYPMEQFADAWADSKNYLITISSRDNINYVPRPIDLSDVKLDFDLTDLREAIAENAHEIWAKTRQDDGWTYGPQRNDELKQTPDMMPYSQLPDSEKKYDREMAMNTIKLLRKLGYDLVRHRDDMLYHKLIREIYNSGNECHCPNCNNVVSENQIFCDKCGHRLRHEE